MVAQGRLAAGALAAALGAGILPASRSAGIELLGDFATWRDRKITESSGLIWWRDHLITTNDSGSEAILFVADRAGAAAGTIRYADADPDDVEALGLGPDDTLWVGDVGDNAAARETIALYRLEAPPLDGTMTATRYEMRYPDGAHNAEAILVHPVTGTVFVVTKEVLGGIYEVSLPAPGGGTATLTRVEGASVPPIVTDGTFSPDGTKIYLRDYQGLTVLSYPAFDNLGSAEAPAQEQGEGVANGPDDTLLASTEGRFSGIQQWRLHLDRFEGGAGTDDSESADGSESTGNSGSATTSTTTSASAADPTGTETTDASATPGSDDAPALPHPGIAALLVLGVAAVGAIVWRRGRRRT